jgi:hypothetical protein
MTLVDSFEAERPRLLNVAYRLTGSVADAEDAVRKRGYGCTARTYASTTSKPGSRPSSAACASTG